MNLWNPKTPVAELPHLTEQLKHRLRSDGYRTADKLDRCPKEQLRVLGYSDSAVGHTARLCVSSGNLLRISPTSCLLKA